MVKTPEGTKPPLHTIGTPSAKPNKGKHKEEDNFHLGWWDVLPLIEGQRPPVQWTNLSLILTAHATEPKVVCLHYPSNKQFTLPSVSLLANSPSSYEPPRVIVANPQGNCIFAYFPGLETDGVGCIWRRMPQLDNWMIKEWWTFPRGGGAVCAQWFSSDREWVISESGLPTRLPSRGPFLSVSHPVLLVVTESHLFNVYYMDHQDSIKVLSSSLRRQGVAREADQRPSNDRLDGPGGLGRVTHATIGLGYNESSAIVATYSSYVPSAPTDAHSSYNMDLDISLGVTESEPESTTTPDFDTWRADNVVELTEIIFRIQGYTMAIGSFPLPPIQLSWPSSHCLTDLLFVPTLPTNQHTFSNPSTPTQTHRTTTPVSSPALAHAHVNISPHSPGRFGQRGPMKGSPKTGSDKMKTLPVAALYLLCTSLDLGQFSSSPRSEVTLYTVARDPSPAAGPTQRRSWVCRRFSGCPVPGVVTHISPSQPTNSPLHCGALMSVLNLDGARREGKRVMVGKNFVFRLPELQHDDTWQPTAIVCPSSAHGVDLPFNSVVSPNRALICTVSSPLMTAHKSATAIHPHPLRFVGPDYGGPTARRLMASSLANSIQKRAMPYDVVHLLALTGTSIQPVEETLVILLRDFKDASNGLATNWITDVLGIAIDVYRQKSLTVRNSVEKEYLSSRYMIAHQILMVTSCLGFWEECYQDEKYDMDAMWGLIGLCEWFIEFTAKLLKECVMFASELVDDKTSEAPPDRENSDPFASPAARNAGNPFEISTELVHLVHPFTFSNVRSMLQHVRRFYSSLTSKSLKTEFANLGRDMLTDIVESSGIDLEVLDKTLTEAYINVKSMSERFPDAGFRVLATLKPTPQHGPLLRQIVTGVVNANIVNKARLFIVPEDLVDGMLGLSTNTSVKRAERDVVSKGVLEHTKHPMTTCCLRCGGTAEFGHPNNVPGLSSNRWSVTEKFHFSHCICGGIWYSKP